MRYVDGYVLPVPTKNLKAYAKMAAKAAKIWMEHGALQVVESVAEDTKVHCGLPFTKAFKPKAGETVVFSWIVFKSCAHRDRVNAKVMKDPRLGEDMDNDPKNMPFDFKRMVYGGFTMLVDE